MAIAVTCANCGVKLRFKSEYQGRSAKCRACENPIVVQGERAMTTAPACVPAEPNRGLVSIVILILPL